MLKRKEVFYIAPNALSFEKEQGLGIPASVSILWDYGDSFYSDGEILYSQYEQPQNAAGWYWSGHDFYKVLSHMGDDELKVYGRLRKDSNFINQLVDLYKELQAG